eukprot:c19020_g1_i4.p1 GENE.c19020_g1_i4~~c19020_g1_i4.p1  ORF type:complete len:210 (+),score=23.30 c19020_g1_i4:106-735(+)
MRMGRRTDAPMHSLHTPGPSSFTYGSMGEMHHMPPSSTLHGKTPYMATSMQPQPGVAKLPVYPNSHYMHVQSGSGGPVSHYPAPTSTPLTSAPTTQAYTQAPGQAAYMVAAGQGRGRLVYPSTAPMPPNPNMAAISGQAVNQMLNQRARGVARLPTQAPQTQPQPQPQNPQAPQMPQMQMQGQAQPQPGQIPQQQPMPQQMQQPGVPPQ